MMLEIKTLIRIGGMLHFAIFLIAIWVPLILNWRENLGRLSRFMRRLVWVYGVFIMFVVLGFGTLSLCHADRLATGTPLATFLCGFIGLFWLARLFVQLFVFDIRPLIRHRVILYGYHCLTAMFTYLAVVYGVAAFIPLEEVIK